MKLRALKKGIALGVACILTASLAGCGGNTAGGNSGTADALATQEQGSAAVESAGGGETKDAPVDIPQPDPDERYSISYTGMWSGADYEDGSYIETMIEDALNVDITVEKAETNDTIDLLLASGEMPDCGWFNKTVNWMYEQELARTIPRAMVEYYCPKLIEYYEEFPLMYEMTLDPENEDQFRYLTGITFQFVDYYLPNDYYRYDWILDLGIDLGVNVEQISDNIYVADDGIELSKFLEIMDAFVNKDPNHTGARDTVGVTAPSLTQGVFFSGYDFYTGVNDVNGRAEQYYVMDEYKEFLKGFADMYKRGLIDPEIITGDRTLSWEKVNNQTAGYWITSTNSLNSWAVERPPLTLIEKYPDVKILATPGVKPDGGEVKARTNESPAYGSFFVNANVDDQKLAKILQFLNYTLFGDGDLDIHASLFYGEKGVDWEWDETGEMPVKLNVMPSGKKGTWTFGQYGQDRDVTRWTTYEPLFVAGLKYWSAEENGSWMKWQTIPYKSDIRSETDYATISSEISSDVWAYVNNYCTEAVLGQIDVDATWDDYLAELDRMGYNKMMDELEKVEPLDDIIASYGK